METNTARLRVFCSIEHLESFIEEKNYSLAHWHYRKKILILGKKELLELKHRNKRVFNWPMMILKRN